MRSLFSSLRPSFSVLAARPAYLAIWALGSLVFLISNFWVKTGWFLSSTLRDDWLTTGQKVRYVENLIGITVRDDATTTILTLTMGILFGAALSSYIFVIRRQWAGKGAAAYSMGGFLSALLGFGCASCGTLILSLLGLGVAVSTLPLRGLEFTLLAVLLLTISILRTSRAIGASSCPNHRLPES